MYYLSGDYISGLHEMLLCVEVNTVYYYGGNNDNNY